MNAGSLWAGQDYAWSPYRQRGVFPMNAVKVKVVKVYKRTVIGNDNSSTFAEVITSSNTNKEVRARDIVDFWSDYEDEKQHRIDEGKRREKERQETYERQSKERLVKEQKLSYENTLISEKLQAIGLNEQGIHSLGPVTLSLLRKDVLVWLGIGEVITDDEVS